MPPVASSPRERSSVSCCESGANRIKKPCPFQPSNDEKLKTNQKPTFEVIWQVKTSWKSWTSTSWAPDSMLTICPWIVRLVVRPSTKRAPRGESINTAKSSLDVRDVNLQMKLWKQKGYKINKTASEKTYKNCKTQTLRSQISIDLSVIAAAHCLEHGTWNLMECSWRFGTKSDFFHIFIHAWSRLSFLQIACSAFSLSPIVISRLDWAKGNVSAWNSKYFNHV